jgi:hypothetical protein
MRTFLLAAAFLTAFGTSNPVRAWWPVTLWSHGYGSTTYQDCQSVATDASGNLFMTGYFVGTVNFGGSDLSSPLGVDIFLVSQLGGCPPVEQELRRERESLRAGGCHRRVRCRLRSRLL